MITSNTPIILENDIFRLVLSESGSAQSLVLKSNGEECLYLDEPLPFFTLTEARPYNNEIKLAHPNKRTTFGAKHIRMEDGKLIVGFELIDFEAVIDVKVADCYMTFTLVDFLVKPDSFGIGVNPIVPPAIELRLVQLPLIHRERFGEWLNVLWDDKAAINVLAPCPYPRIDSEKRRDCHILFGEALRNVKLKGCGVSLIVSEPDRLLDAIDRFEQDYGLPRGVESRRSPLINRSYYWTSTLNPETVDEHIKYAKLGGFKFMSVYYCSVLREAGAYRNTGEYDIYNDNYPNGREDLVKVLNKVKAAGIIPGLHLLHSHIGLRSKYLTPVADHRLNLTKHFTLARPLTKDDTTIYVEECPEGSPVFEKCRVLKFMGELISYESYTTERPYCFKGCVRGFNDTYVREHDIGTIGGILDISEFASNSAYIDQNSSLQDEVAKEAAKFYDAGFEFIYYDGSEGVNPPFEINVGLAQWRVYEKVTKKPIFCEGAAKSHFSWHMLSGGNAFDTFGPDIFKEMIVKHPFEEAPRMANDLTRLNFGWWRYRKGQRADILEYGTSLAAAWDCPGAFIATLESLRTEPRIPDVLEVLRRWEDARATGFITDEVKKQLRDTNTEHTLLINEKGEYELTPYYQVKEVAGGDPSVTAFVFSRAGKSYAVIWHNRGDGKLWLSLGGAAFTYTDGIGGNAIEVERDGDAIVLPIAGKRYLATELSMDALRDAVACAVLV